MTNMPVSPIEQSDKDIAEDVMRMIGRGKPEVPGQSKSPKLLDYLRKRKGIEEPIPEVQPDMSTPVNNEYPFL